MSEASNEGLLSPEHPTSEPKASETKQNLPQPKKEVEHHFEVTEQNILFLKHLQSGMSVKDAYKMAGYEGQSPNDPYNFYWKLKRRLQAIIEADSLDELRLRSKLSEIINLPLKFDPKSTDRGITVKELLKAVETTDKVLNGHGKLDSKPQITAFVVQRFEKADKQPDAVVEAERLPD